jgi:hypothetical protein
MIFAGQYRVIDWMTGCMGDPLSDTARTALIPNYAEIPRASFIVNFIVGLFQKSIRKKYLREYTSLTNASIPDIDKWELPLAAARLCEWIPEGESKKLLSLVRRRVNTKGTNTEEYVPFVSLVEQAAKIVYIKLYTIQKEVRHANLRLYRDRPRGQKRQSGQLSRPGAACG